MEDKDKKRRYNAWQQAVDESWWTGELQTPEIVKPKAQKRADRRARKAENEAQSSYEGTSWHGDALSYHNMSGHWGLTVR